MGVQLCSLFVGAGRHDMDYFKTAKTKRFFFIVLKIIFAYLEADNPGLGTIAEIGYAIGLGKTVILVCEESKIHEDRYLDFTRELASITFSNLEDGITYLKTFK